MSGAVKSLGQFAGLSGGPQAPGGQFGNSGLDQLNQQNSVSGDFGAQNLLGEYAKGNLNGNSFYDQAHTGGFTAAQEQGLSNALATGATTGSKYATEQVQNNPILGSLFGQNGELNKQTGILDNLQSQGFNLKPEDQSLYGQAAGGIARQFGSQGNQAASNLAARGLSSSGAAGATFSGIQGNQNEMLAQAQQQIAQQRFQNTQNQVAQQQSFISQLGQQGANAINQQYGRQLSGAQNQTNQLGQAAGTQVGQNSAQNNYGLQKSMFDAENTPKNFMDFAAAGTGQGIQSGMSQAASGGNYSQGSDQLAKGKKS